MNNSAIIMFLFGAIMLWGGSIYFLWKLLKDHKRKIGINNKNNKNANNKNANNKNKFVK